MTAIEYDNCQSFSDFYQEYRKEEFYDDNQKFYDERYKSEGENFSAEKNICKIDEYDDIIDYSKVTREDVKELQELDKKTREISPYPELLENPVDIKYRLTLIYKTMKPEFYPIFLSEIITSKGFAKIKEEWLRK